MMDDLFPETRTRQVLAPGAAVLGGFAKADAPALLQAIEDVLKQAPLRRYKTARGGQLAAAMTACGRYGWVSDGRGYRYDELDPLTGRAWPTMPLIFQSLAVRAAQEAGYKQFMPQSGLINRYDPGAGMGLHQDCDEQVVEAPIISVSLGLSAIFQWGGATRNAPCRKVPLHHGDVVVWGGPSRHNFHGIMPIKPGPAVAGLGWRYNLTFRTVR